MQNIYILFDCPDARNDKKWLLEELSKLHNGKVSSVPIKHVLSRLDRSGIIGKLRARAIALWQCLRALMRSEKDDVLICWAPFTGKMCATLSRLFGNKRKLILMNWLTPSDLDKRWEKTCRMILNNPQCRISVNSADSPKEWAALAGVTTTENFFLMPDVFDTSVTWAEPAVKEERYCFTGGMNNRDWKLLSQIARACSDIRFVCVALEEDFNAQVEDRPENMDVYFNLPAAEYYGLMNNAHAVLLPLRDSRVAGLINIIRAAQAGVLCYISRTVSTEQYYPQANADMLVDWEQEAWISAVQKSFALTAQDYTQKVKSNQMHILENFSAEAAAKRIAGILADM